MAVYVRVNPGGVKPPDAFQYTTEVTFTNESGFEVIVDFRSILVLEEAARVLADVRDEEWRRINNRRAKLDHLREEIARDETETVLDDYQWPEDRAS